MSNENTEELTITKGPDDYILYSPEGAEITKIDCIQVNFGKDCPEYRVLENVCKDLGMGIVSINVYMDILAIPQIMVILNPDTLSADDLELIEWSTNYLNNKKSSILFTKEPAFKLTTKMKSYSIKRPLAFNYESLQQIIQNRRNSISENIDDSEVLDKKLYRMMHIMLSLMDKRKNVKMSDWCDELNVSDTTILKDIDMLKTLGNHIEYNKITHEWEMPFCRYEFDYHYDNDLKPIQEEAK
ncbi:MAG: HTH domain-containing protein [bacterium]